MVLVSVAFAGLASEAALEVGKVSAVCMCYFEAGNIVSDGLSASKSPKRVRWMLDHKPKVISFLFR